MFAISLIFSALSFALSSPIDVSGTAPGEYSPLVVLGCTLPDAVNVARYRTKSDIIWSCLATIFACTWVAVHLNLPGPSESTWTRLKRRLIMMAYAMIAPEMIAIWAMYQWKAARNIVGEFNKTHVEKVSWYKLCWRGIRDAVKECFDDPGNRPEGWTLTHGFLIQMGGFILYEGKKPIRVLTAEYLKTLVEEKKVDLPDISEHEINDKSKGDFFTKLFAVLQTSWFIFQCLTRWVLHLPVTELEVVTLVFAALNIITYVFWWNKPQNVLVAIRVQLNDGSSVEPVTDTDEKESWISRKLGEAVDDGWFGRLVLAPCLLIIGVLRPINKMLDIRYGGRGVESLRVPMFYSGKRVNGIETFFPMITIAVLFGGLHLIPWSFQFPSTAELWLWRSSAIVITVEPIVLVVLFIAAVMNDHGKDGGLSGNVLAVFIIPGTLGLPLYILARITLLVLAFITLRVLPPGWNTAIIWTNYLPHI